MRTALAATAFIASHSLATAGPLHDAAKQGDVEHIRQLLANGADPNIRSKNSIAFGTPLEIARGIGNEEIIEILVQHGAR